MAIAIATMSCNYDKIISESDLPDNSLEFIHTHFAGVEILQIEKERDNNDISYDVMMGNGFFLEFAESGRATCVDGGFTLVPLSIVHLLPAGINTYLAAKHPSSKVVKIDEDRGYIEIDLDNFVMDLVFTTEGTFVRYDD